MSDKKSMPDVALEQSEQYRPLTWVGMTGIELPLLYVRGDEKIRIPAKARAQVSLDLKSSRGIHMSRLFVEVQKLSQENLNFTVMNKSLAQFLDTHRDLSSRAILEVELELPLQRKALKSENFGWRNYPVKMTSLAVGSEVFNYLEFVVTYSSTCPASAALARQLIQDNFKTHYTGEMNVESIVQWLGGSDGISATPHAQRSTARIKVQVDGELNIDQLIDAVEESLQTPVQTAVKREDEQEFALRNGQNLMFCEDAARRVSSCLSDLSSVTDYYAMLTHQESLHPHNAVAIASKGLKLQGFDF